MSAWQGAPCRLLHQTFPESFTAAAGPRPPDLIQYSRCPWEGAAQLAPMTRERQGDPTKGGGHALAAGVMLIPYSSLVLQQPASGCSSPWPTAQVPLLRHSQRALPIQDRVEARAGRAGETAAQRGEEHSSARAC